VRAGARGSVSFKTPINDGLFHRLALSIGGISGTQLTLRLDGVIAGTSTLATGVRDCPTPAEDCVFQVLSNVKVITSESKNHHLVGPGT